MRIFVGPLLAIIVGTFPHPLAAQDGEIRRITQTTATSDCIGNPETPICAVDTLFACHARVLEHLCGSVGSPAIVRGEKTIEYRLISSEEFENRSYVFIDDQRQVIPKTVELGFHRRSCDSEFNSCPNDQWHTVYFTLVPHRDRWTIMIAGGRPAKD